MFVLPWSADTPDVTHLSMLIQGIPNVYESGFPFPLVSSNFIQPLKRNGTTFHRLQSTVASIILKWKKFETPRLFPRTRWSL